MHELESFGYKRRLLSVDDAPPQAPADGNKRARDAPSRRPSRATSCRGVEQGTRRGVEQGTRKRLGGQFALDYLRCQRTLANGRLQRPLVLPCGAASNGDVCGVKYRDPASNAAYLGRSVSSPIVVTLRNLLACRDLARANPFLGTGDPGSERRKARVRCHSGMRLPPSYRKENQRSTLATYTTNATPMAT
jgi:hypothetical protein